MCSEGCEGVRLPLSSCVEILVESDPNVSERVFERSDRLGFRDGCRAWLGVESGSSFGFGVL